MCVENGHVQEVNGHTDAATPPPQVTDSTAPDADSTAPVDDSKAPVEEKKKKKKKGTATKKVKKSASTVSKSSASKSSESSTLTVSCVLEAIVFLFNDRLELKRNVWNMKIVKITTSLFIVYDVESGAEQWPLRRVPSIESSW